VNFTREPIIETIISPKEGCKLLIRNSKSAAVGEEYFVDAVEVVSFGHAFFFRSLEHPKAFLVPVSDYEVLEVKEMRVALKNVSHERNIKIGGGREAPFRPSHKEPPQEREQIIAAEEESQPIAEEAGQEAASSTRTDKRRDRRRRHRRPSEDQEWSERRRSQKQPTESPLPESEQKAQGGGAEDEAKVSSSMFSSLIPPPPTLISQTLSRYKDKEFMEQGPAKEIESKEKKQPPSDEEPTGSESSPLHRVSAPLPSETSDTGVFSSTYFSPLQGGGDPFSF
jgi:hypothetical protein